MTPLVILADEVYSLHTPLRQILSFPLLLGLQQWARSGISEAPMGTLIVGGLLWIGNAYLWGFGLVWAWNRLRRLLGGRKS